MGSIKNTLNKYLWKASVRNYSNKVLWVVETTTKTKGFQAVAHKLKPGMKSPRNIDADGFKRVDGGAIEGHKEWWNIRDLFQAYIYSYGRSVKAIVLLYKKAVSLHEFGEKVYYDKSDNWGDKIIHIVDVKRNKDRKIESYFIEGKGWVTKNRAITLAINGDIDNVVIVEGKNGIYLRSRPDKKNNNNFSNMG